MATHQHKAGLAYSKLLMVLLALYALTAITIFVSQIDMGALNIWVALLVASIKSTLVLLFFMHLRYESNFLKLSFAITIFTLALVIAFIFWDVAFR